MGADIDRLVKLQGGLRKVANGRDTVNEIRSTLSGVVKSARPTEAYSGPVLSERSVVTRREQVKEVAPGERGKQDQLSAAMSVSVFVLTDEKATTPKGVNYPLGKIGTAMVPIAELARLDADPAVQSIELATTVKLPKPRAERAFTERPESKSFATMNEKWFRLKDYDERTDFDRKTGKFKAEKQAWPIGENVLIGIIDVGGLDFAHPDFIDKNGNSRVIAIWDQGGTAFGPPTVDGEKETGSEITAADIAEALKDYKDLKVSPYDLAPQSQQDIGSHATHVASIAAGNEGVCRHAKIAGVMISIPDDEISRMNSFYDTGRIVAAVQYLTELAARDPEIDAVAINISLGTNGGPHDGSDLMSRWLDLALADKGRVVTVAAGNAGQEKPRSPDDFGHFLGRVHAKGTVPATGLMRDLEWVVVGNGIEDISDNEMEIWYSPSDEIAVSIKPPGGQWIGPVKPRQRLENVRLPNDTMYSVYNDLNDPKNGFNKISIFLSPFMGDPVVGITPGVWRVRLLGTRIRDGRFNAWIERDDPGQRAGALWQFPSYFGEASFVDESTVSSLACGPRVIGVANLDEAREMIAETSSQGPTRDGRTKPDIAAPGTDIIAAKGFDRREQWVAMSGTSMASPYACGVAALMLSMHPKLSAAQIAGIMRRTSDPLPGGGYDWHNASGFGILNPFNCLNGVVRLLTPVRDLAPGKRSSKQAAGAPAAVAMPALRPGRRRQPR